MTAFAPRGSKAAVEAVYEDMAPLVREIAERFAQHYGRDPEECLGDANLAFLEAYHGFDPELNPNLGARIRTVLQSRLLDRYRNETGHRLTYKLNRVDVDPELMGTPRPIPEFDGEQLFDSVGEDAQVVLKLILEAPDELKEELEKPQSPKLLKKCLRRYLIDNLKWASERVTESFQEIKAALS